MLGNLIGPEIEDLISGKNFAELREVCLDLRVPELAEVIEDMDVSQAAVLFRVLPRDTAADVFEYLAVDVQERLLRAFGQEQVAAVLNEMAPDDRTALLAELPAAVTSKLLALLAPAERKIATTLLGYPDGTVGRRMTPDYIAVPEHWRVREVLEHIRQVGRKLETFNILYVTGDRHVLRDDLRLRELLLSDPETEVADLVDGRFVSLSAEQSQEEAVSEFKRWDYTMLPVVDSAGVLVGIVTVDDVLDIAEEEHTEDVHKMAAVETLEAPYLQVSMGELIRKRGVWLLVLFLGQTLTATVMGAFETELQRAIVLATFIPLVISTGGNTGSQASSLIIRAMTLAQVQLADWFRVFRRELVCGAALGIALGLLGFVRIVLWHQLGWADYGPYWLQVALTVWLALVGVVVFGSLVGSMLPFTLARLKLDPAAGSAPFVATLVDVSGIVIYFTVALLILSELLSDTATTQPL